MTICPLCLNKKSFTIIEGKNRITYKRCEVCKLIFIDSCFLPSSTDEKKRYLTHKNGIQQKGYVDFLMQAIEQALPHINTEMQGLDFGCGPNPTLSEMLGQMGYSCSNYDPFFFPALPDKKYDFIFATECFEHFFFPAKEIVRIKNLLNPGGVLIVMTETWKTTERFVNWHYVRDSTHVCFFHDHSFRYIADKFKFKQIESSSDRVFMFKLNALE